MSENSSNDYGLCPMCGAPGETRERRPNGNDRCVNGRTYPSRQAVYLVDDDPDPDLLQGLRARAEQLRDLALTYDVVSLESVSELLTQQAQLTIDLINFVEHERSRPRSDHRVG